VYLLGFGPFQDTRELSSAVDVAPLVRLIEILGAGRWLGASVGITHLNIFEHRLVTTRKPTALISKPLLDHG
jgi:hypothetical protein